MRKRSEMGMTPEQLAALPDDQIDYSDIPELGPDFWKNAELVQPDRAEHVTLRVKQSVLNAFKAQGKGHTSRMSAVLESYARAMLQTEKDGPSPAKLPAPR